MPSLKQQEENLQYLKSEQWEDQGYCCLMRHVGNNRESGFLIAGEAEVRVNVGDFSSFIYNDVPPKRINTYSSYDDMVQDGWLID